MKKIILAFILFIVMSGANTVQAKASDLVDIENHWARENILRQVANGVVVGYEDNTFRPDNPITTLEFMKVIFHTLHINLVEDGLRKWPDYYIATAKSYDLPENYDEQIHRYEAAEIIVKLMKLENKVSSKNSFKDVNKENKNNVMQLVNLGIIYGYEDQTFRGENNITRAEAITIALRAYDVMEKINQNKKTEFTSKNTNLFERENWKANQARYDVQGDKIYFYDNGRFAYLEEETIDEKYISNQKIMKIMKSLVDDNSYTALYYVPSSYIINQVLIKYGENEQSVGRNMDYFNITYYEDKLYDLARVTLNETFSKECYMRVEVKKLWKENYEFSNQKYVNDTIKNKLLDALKVEFGSDAEEILKYILENYLKFMNGEFTEGKIAKQMTIKKYKINFYKTDATSLDFYIEKLSS